MRSLFLITALCTATPALAQSAIDSRVGKLESEMRAVQRKVFPGGAQASIEPQIRPGDTAPLDAPGTPATSAVADLTGRVASLEGQMATLTGQIEQNQYRVRQLEEAFAAYRKATDAKLSAGTTPEPTGEEPADAPPPPRGSSAGGSPTRDTGRAAQIAGLQRPATGDAAEDSYLYGYRLWEAKLYPEAVVQLKKVVADHPKHRRASYAQNLVGRAYLDDGKPSLASIAFYDNYKKMPDGERASQSLYYLAQALVRLKKPADACKVYGELSDVYGGKIDATMQSNITRGRAEAKCTA